MMPCEEQGFPIAWNPSEMLVRMAAELAQQLGLGALIERDGTAQVVMFSSNGREERIRWFPVSAKVDLAFQSSREGFYLAKEMLDAFDRRAFLEREPYRSHPAMYAAGDTKKSGALPCFGRRRGARYFAVILSGTAFVEAGAGATSAGMPSLLRSTARASGVRPLVGLSMRFRIS